MPASRTRKKGKFWCRVPVCNDLIEVRVYEDYWALGEYIKDEGLIIVRRSTVGRMQDTLMHEVLHAVLENSSGAFLFRSHHRIKRSAWLSDMGEEFLVRMLTPWLLNIGWLKVPAPPKPRKVKDDE
jgi:hypothetical protein